MADDEGAKRQPRCYEYQLEKDRTRVFLRSRTAYASTIPARVLAAPGKSPVGALLSVDDRVWQKQAVRAHHREIDERARPAGFFRRNLWWLLAFSLVVLGNFLHVGAGASPADSLSLPYAMTGGLLLALWFWRARASASAANKSADRVATSEALGETIPLTDNLPSVYFGEPDAGARHALGLDFAEGQVSEVKYSFFDLPCEEYDPSVVVLEFLLRQRDGVVLACRHEVARNAPLFFVCAGDDVRLLGWITAGNMTIKHAANLADGHVCNDFLLLSLGPGESAGKGKGQGRGNGWFFLRLLGESVAIACAVVAGFAGLGFLMVWCIGLLVGFDAEFREMLRHLGYASAVATGFALLVGLRNGVRNILRARRVASALGLNAAEEVISRQRVVCNQRYCL